MFRLITYKSINRMSRTHRMYCSILGRFHRTSWLYQAPYLSTLTHVYRPTKLCGRLLRVIAYLYHI